MILLLFLASCGADEALELVQLGDAPVLTCSAAEQRLTMKVIIGDTDWSDYVDLKNASEIRNSRSTGQIKIPAINASCTAFLINENTIMTNNHCIPDQNYAYGVRLLLRDENQQRETFYCETLLATNSVLDFSLLECERYPGEKYGFIPLSLNVPAKEESMYLVQENCDYLSQPRCQVRKYIAKGKIHRLALNSLGHDADTLGGSSGSPIFDQETHELIGIHHAGMSRSGSSPAMNFGIPMHRIANYLSRNHADIDVYKSRTIQNRDDTSDHCTEYQ
jgi:hypothetical protein